MVNMSRLISSNQNKKEPKRRLSGEMRRLLAEKQRLRNQWEDAIGRVLEQAEKEGISRQDMRAIDVKQWHRTRYAGDTPFKNRDVIATY